MHGSQLMPIVKHLCFPVGLCPARLAALLLLKPACCICHDWSPGPCPWCVCICMPEGGCDPAAQKQHVVPPHWMLRETGHTYLVTLAQLTYVLTVSSTAADVQQAHSHRGLSAAGEVPASASCPAAQALCKGPHSAA